MKIEELRLISINQEYVGGSTKPLLINAENKNGDINPYILKLFKTSYVKQNFTLAKEIISTTLAKEFDLPVPECGIINFDHILLKDFFDDKPITLLDRGYKFCSKFEEAYVIYNPLTDNNALKEYDIENVFAFDNLILNTDRGGFRNKPNLLVSDENILLIDHEQIMPFYDSYSIGHSIAFKEKYNSYYHKNHCCPIKI